MISVYLLLDLLSSAEKWLNTGETGRVGELCGWGRRSADTERASVMLHAKDRNLKAKGVVSTEAIK